MAWRVWSKLCCSQKWILLISPLLLLLLLFLTVLVMAITLPLPLPPSGTADRRPSRALSSAGDFERSGPGVAEPPPRAAFFESPFRTHSGAWRAGAERETPKHPSKPFEEAGSDYKGRSDTNSKRNRHKGIDASKRKENTQARSHRKPRLPEITVNSAEPKHRIMASNHNTGVKLTTDARRGRSKSTAAAAAPADSIISDRGAADRQASTWRDEHTNSSAGGRIHADHASAKQQGLRHDSEKGRQATRRLGRFRDEGRRAAKEPASTLGKKPRSSEGRAAPSKSKAAGQKDDGGGCRSLGDQDVPVADRRRIRVNPDLLPWLSRDDVRKMELLAAGQVVSKASVPAHGQVLQVALDPPGDQQTPIRGSGPREVGHGQGATHGERCQRGRCALVKRTDDWYEVFAFHLDRVLGLNRSLPAVLRAFRSDLLPYRFTGGTPRPAVWWDPGIQHLADDNNDQNSVPLSWVQYQQLLRAHCGSQTELSSPPCVGVRHSEWGRLALFDFLLQVNDRLDRYCCGFRPEPTEMCVENLLHAKCGNDKHLLLVHILVRTADSSRLVFIDNAGRPQQSPDNLNFRLVEGIDEFPERAVSVLRSGCLENLLLRSLYADRELWDSRGGAGGLRPLVRAVQQRGDILLRHITDKKLRLKSDL